MGRFIFSVLSLWVTGLISAAAALALGVPLSYLEYLVLSVAISLKGLIPLVVAIGWLRVWKQERSGNQPALLSAS